MPNNEKVAEGVLFLAAVAGVGAGLFSKQWLADESAFGLGLIVGVMAFFAFGWLIARSPS
jgi:hypothetical protein